MTADDFNAWLEKEGFSAREAARHLGCSKDTVAKYKLKGAPVYIGLACAALSFGLPAWRKVDD